MVYLISWQLIIRFLLDFDSDFDVTMVPFYAEFDKIIKIYSLLSGRFHLNFGPLPRPYRALICDD